MLKQNFAATIREPATPIVMPPRAPVIAVNDEGRRIGQSHHRAKLSDAEVDLMRELHEDYGFGYRRLAAKFECGVTTVRHIVTYAKRAQTPMRFK